MQRTLAVRLTPHREETLKKAAQYIAENGGKRTKRWPAERIIEALLESDQVLDWANGYDPRPLRVITEERRKAARAAEAFRVKAKDEWTIVPSYAVHGRDADGGRHPSVKAWFRAIAAVTELRVSYTEGWWSCRDCGSLWDGHCRGEKRFWECPGCPVSIRKRRALGSMRKAWARDFKGQARAFRATEAKAKRAAERDSKRLDRIAAKLTSDQACDVHLRTLRRTPRE